MKGVIVGASGNIGGQILRLTMEAGHEVLATYSQHEIKMKPAKTFKVDLSDSLSMDSFVDYIQNNYNKLDYLVLAFGQSANQRIEEVESIALQKYINTYLLNMILLIQRLKSLLVNGQIVILNTLSGTKMIPAPLPVATLGGGIKGAVEALAKELGESQIKINSVAVGLLENGVSQRVSSNLRNQYLKHCCLGRMGQPEEVANWVFWLIEKNSYITGQSIILDGGL